MRATTKLLPPRRNGAFALERRPVLLTQPCRRVPTEGGGPDTGADSTPHTQTDPLLGENGRDDGVWTLR